MSKLINFNYVLKTALYPNVPMFVGSWNNKASVTKWRGSAAEFAYNSYLRNGWVVVDTGIKATAGTPIIEFSTWESEKSRYNLIFPKALSYKLFLGENSWRSGYLTRTAVAANENWVLSRFSYPSFLNSYTTWATHRERSLSFTTQPLCNNNLYSNLVFNSNQDYLFTTTAKFFNSIRVFNNNVRLNLKYKYNTLRYGSQASRFFTNDRFFSGSFYSKYKTNVAPFLLSRVFLNLFARLTRHTSNPFLLSHPILETPVCKTFYATLFRLNVIVVLYTSLRCNQSYTFFLNKLLNSSVRSFVSILIRVCALRREISLLQPQATKALIEFFFTRISFLINSSTLSTQHLPKLICYFLTSYALRFIPKLSLTLMVGSHGRNYLDTKTYKFTSLRLNSLFNKHLSSELERANLATTALISSNKFFSSYIKAKTWWSKKGQTYINLRLKKKNFFLTSKKKTKSSSNKEKKVKWYKRSWNKLTSYFKLFSLRKQFFFTSFWSFNFFNLSLNVKQGKYGRVFLRTVRLIHFFKNFFKFFKFYSFYFNVLKLTLTHSTLTNRGVRLTNLSTFLWALHLKFWKVLRAFYSLSKKFFTLTWRNRLISLAKIGSFFNKLVTPKFARTVGAPLTTVFLNKRDLRLPKKAGVLAIFLKTYLAFNKFQMPSTLLDATVAKRKYLSFLLTIRRSSVNIMRSLLSNTLLPSLSNIVFQAPSSSLSWDAKRSVLLNLREFLNNRKLRKNNAVFNFLTVFGRALHTDTVFLRSSSSFLLNFIKLIIRSLGKRKFGLPAYRLNKHLNKLKKTIISFFNRLVKLSRSDSMSLSSLRLWLRVVWTASTCIRHTHSSNLKLLTSQNKQKRFLFLKSASLRKYSPRLLCRSKIKAFGSLYPLTAVHFLKLKKNLFITKQKLRSEFSAFSSLLQTNKHVLAPELSIFSNFLKAFSKRQQFLYSFVSLVARRPFLHELIRQFSIKNEKVLNFDASVYTRPFTWFSAKVRSDKNTPVISKFKRYAAAYRSDKNSLLLGSLNSIPSLPLNVSPSKLLNALPARCDFGLEGTQLIVKNSLDGYYTSYKTLLADTQISLSYFTLFSFTLLSQFLRGGHLYSLVNLAVSSLNKLNILLACFFKSRTLFFIFFQKHHVSVLSSALLRLKKIAALSDTQNFWAFRPFRQNILKVKPTVFFSIRAFFKSFFLKSLVLNKKLFSRTGANLQILSNCSNFASQTLDFDFQPIKKNPKLFSKKHANLFARHSILDIYFRNYITWLIKLRTRGANKLKHKGRALSAAKISFPLVKARVRVWKRFTKYLRKLKTNQYHRTGKIFSKSRVVLKFALSRYRKRIAKHPRVLLLKHSRVLRNQREFFPLISRFRRKMRYLSRYETSRTFNIFKFAKLSIFKSFPTLTSINVGKMKTLLLFRNTNLLRNKYSFHLSLIKNISRNPRKVYLNKVSLHFYRTYIARFLQLFAFNYSSPNYECADKFQLTKITSFHNMRSVPRLLLEANLRKMGLLTRIPRYKNFKGRRFPWWIPRSVRNKLKAKNRYAKDLWKSKRFFNRKPVLRKFNAKLPSFFDRRNHYSMQLVGDFKDLSFRAIRLKGKKSLFNRFKIFLRSICSRAVRRTVELWTKRFLRRYRKVFRRSRLLKTIKRNRKFYFKRRFRLFFRKRFYRRVIKKCIKLLTFVKYDVRQVRIYSFSKIYRKVKALKRRKLVLDYSVLRRLLVRNFFNKLYTYYNVCRDKTRIALFRGLRFSFILKFLNFFFKRTYSFFFYFVSISKKAAINVDSFSHFFSKFTASLTEALSQSVLSYTNLDVFSDIVSIFGSLRKRVLTVDSTLNVLAPTSLLTLTLMVTRLSVFASPCQLLYFSSFDTPASFRVWKRFLNKHFQKINISNMLIVNRVTAYSNTLRINLKGLYLKTKKLKLKSGSVKLNFFRKVSNLKSSSLNRTDLTLPPFSWNSLPRLTKLTQINTLRLSLPLLRLLKVLVLRGEFVSRGIKRDYKGRALKTPWLPRPLYKLKRVLDKTFANFSKTVQRIARPRKASKFLSKERFLIVRKIDKPWLLLNKKKKNYPHLKLNSKQRSTSKREHSLNETRVSKRIVTSKSSASVTKYRGFSTQACYFKIREPEFELYFGAKRKSHLSIGVRRLLLTSRLFYKFPLHRRYYATIVSRKTVSYPKKNAKWFKKRVLRVTKKRRLNLRPHLAASRKRLLNFALRHNKALTFLIKRQKKHLRYAKLFASFSHFIDNYTIRSGKLLRAPLKANSLSAFLIRRLKLPTTFTYFVAKKRAAATSILATNAVPFEAKSKILASIPGFDSRTWVHSLAVKRLIYKKPLIAGYSYGNRFSNFKKKSSIC